MKTVTIHAYWDEEAAVWVAESQDVPGLVTEADNLEVLRRRLEEMVPELLELNSHLVSSDLPDPVPFDLISSHVAKRHHAH